MEYDMNKYSWRDKNVYGTDLQYIIHEIKTIEFADITTIINIKLNGYFVSNTNYMYEIKFKVKIDDIFNPYTTGRINEDSFWSKNIGEYNALTYNGINEAIKSCYLRNSHINNVRKILHNVTADKIMKDIINLFCI